MTDPVPPAGVLSGHVLDLDAVVHLIEGKSMYGRAVVRQSSAHGVTLLVPALAVQVLSLGPIQPRLERFLRMSMVVTGALSPGDAVEGGPYAQTIMTSLRRHRPAAADALLPDVLVAAHAAVHAIRRDWRIITATPYLYEGIDVRLEILP
ncbi:hypothetical protein OHB01_28765 [Microbispora hainanensis]|uniref:Type II toxin-antitoxin system VapC family toxin n=1 Tax=Microbispora hainanensis TaxID=568844 RepID=A0ABZ1SVF6_9ACTN|nr:MULTISPECIES: hypothetical protein [Microbispora]NJP26084.1 hypothetical protein [Microbispora sp. CL1-1]TQS12852.1 hypothetical protein FLW53_18125 [Microbispora sp. SCL1-1]